MAKAIRANNTSKRGFASMTLEERSRIAKLGGHAQGKAVNSGNFANDCARAIEAGRKGGLARRGKHYGRYKRIAP